MCKVILFVSVMFIPFLLNGQNNGGIKGKIISKGESVPFANIIIKSTGKGTASDVNGRFSINEIPAGEHEIIVSSLGFNKFKKKVTIESGKETELKVELTESSHELQQVVVTGTMKESFVMASPVKVEVINQEFLKKAPTNNIMEAIQTVNGVQEQINCGVCGTSDIHINGMEGPYTLVLIDGMPIMSALSSVYGLNGIATSLIDRIEIIKGPSSTLYGTEAVGGLINVITKSPENVSLVSLNAFGTSHLEKNIDLSFAPKGEKLKALFSGNYYNMNNFIDGNNDNFSDIPLLDRISLFGKVSIKRKENRLFNISAKYYYENRFGGIKEWTPEFRGSDSIYGESIFTKRYELVSSYQLPLKEKIRWDISFNNHDQDSYYGDTQYDAEQTVLFSNLIWDKRFGARNDLVAGTSMRYNRYDDNSPATLSADKVLIPGVYVQNEFAATEKLSILGGMRYDFHSNHGSIFSPRLNLKYKPGVYTTIRFNSGTGFRVVNLFTEDHAALTGARTVVIKNELSPEESYNSTLNINHVFNIGASSCTFDADLFYTYYTNKIIPDYDTDENLIIYDNLIGHSVSRGIAFNFHQNFKFPFRYNIGATFMDVYSISKNTEGVAEKEIQEFAPKISGVFTLAYEFKRIRTSIDYTGRVVGPMALPAYASPFERPEISPWFSLQNVQITHKLNKQIDLYLGAKNILDYTQPSPLIDPQNPFGPNFDTAYAYGPLQGRRFFLGIRANLGK